MKKKDIVEKKPDTQKLFEILYNNLDKRLALEKAVTKTDSFKK